MWPSCHTSHTLSKLRSLQLGGPVVETLGFFRACVCQELSGAWRVESQTPRHHLAFEIRHMFFYMRNISAPPQASIKSTTVDYTRYRCTQELKHVSIYLYPQTLHFNIPEKCSRS